MMDTTWCQKRWDNNENSSTLLRWQDGDERSLTLTSNTHGLQLLIFFSLLVSFCYCKFGWFGAFPKITLKAQGYLHWIPQKLLIGMFSKASVTGFTWWNKLEYPEKTTEFGRADTTIPHGDTPTGSCYWTALMASEGTIPVLSRPFHMSPSSEIVSSSTPSWQILTEHAQPFRGARDLAFCLKVPHDSLLVWASGGGSGEPARGSPKPWLLA